MKKLLLLALIAPLCLFAKDERRSSFYYPHSTNASTVTKHAHKKRVDLRPFWKDMDKGDYRAAYQKLCKVKPRTFDDKRYVLLCHLRLRAIAEQLMEENCS